MCGEQGLGVKVKQDGVVSRKKEYSKRLSVSGKGPHKVLVSYREGGGGDSLIIVDLMVSFAEVRGGRWVMHEVETKLFVKVFTILHSLLNQQFMG